MTTNTTSIQDDNDNGDTKRHEGDEGDDSRHKGAPAFLFFTDFYCRWRCINATR